MARPLRSFAPGDYYHLTTRGNDRQAIFLDDDDRNVFVRLLDKIAIRHLLDILVWCQMTNHYHLVVTARTGRISEPLRFLNGEYARAFNERHARTGHLFGDRFAATLVLDEDHFHRARRYVLDNPVRAGMVARAEDWPWSGAVGTAP